jgi:hypothetical protein
LHSPLAVEAAHGRPRKNAPIYWDADDLLSGGGAMKAPRVECIQTTA